jgi:ComF family protein
MSYLENIKKLAQAFLDLLFPISCLVCGADGIFLCEKCFENLPRLDKQECLVCQTPSPFGKTHHNCASKNKIDGILSALPYQNRSVKKIIETFKYNFVSELKVPLGRLIVKTIRQENLTEYFNEFTIIPVPLHPRRYNWRGFNQAQLLADELSEILRIPVDNQTVTRFKFTKPQTKLTHDERKKNIENAFAIAGLVADKKFLLVDDVVTTGSTLNEIAKILKSAQAAEVWAITAAHG